MNRLDDYKELLRRLDAVHQQGGNGDDDLLDQMDVVWDDLSDEERASIRQYSVELYDRWPPVLLYKDAVRVLAGIPADNAPNDVTPPAVREQQRNNWRKRRDDAWARMTDEEKGKS